MIDILFFAQNGHQYDYFIKLKENLNFKIEVVRLTHLCYKSLIETDEILEYKKKEIFYKYSEFKANLYFNYVKFITPYFECNYDYFIKKFNPKMVGLWNGVKYPQNIALKLSQNLKHLFFENGFLPNTTQVDFKGVNALNSVPRDIEFYKKLNYTNLSLPKELVPRKFEGNQQIVKVKLPEKFIFVPFQVAYDSQIIYFSDFKSMRELFYLIKEISEKLDLSFVFKEHPSDKKSDYSDLYKETNDKVIFANSISTQELIEKSEAVITINSSVGMESLLFHKKVFVLGEAFYRIDGIVKPTTKKELLNDLKDDFEIDEKLVNNFLFYLLNEYLVKDSWKNPSQEHFEEISKRLELEL